jgi:hypothetical protein
MEPEQKEPLQEFYIPVEDDFMEDIAMLDNLKCLSPIQQKQDFEASDYFSKLSDIESKNYQ